MMVSSVDVLIGGARCTAVCTVRRLGGSTEYCRGCVPGEVAVERRYAELTVIIVLCCCSVLRACALVVS